MATTGKAMTKTEVSKALAEKTKLSKNEVDSVLDALADLIGDNLGKNGPGVFLSPGC